MLADRIGERAVIPAGLVGAAAALAACGETDDLAGLAALLAVAGMFGASVNAASGRAVMGWFPRAQRGLALGRRQTAIPIGGAAAAIVLPLLAETWSPRAAFLALAAGCLAGALVGVIFVRDAPPHAEAEPGPGRSPVRDPRMWTLSGGSVLLLVAQIA